MSIRFLIAVRHGSYDPSDDNSLSQSGLGQMRKLRLVIAEFLAEKIKPSDGEGEYPPRRVVFSFSDKKRAIESAGLLRDSDKEDIIVTNLHLANRNEIHEPDEILKKVLGLGAHYNASVITIVAHGAMPAVIVETASEFVTKKEPERLPKVAEASGFIVDMTNGEIAKITPNDLEERMAALMTPQASVNTTTLRSTAPPSGVPRKE